MDIMEERKSGVSNRKCKWEAYFDSLPIFTINFRHFQARPIYWFRRQSNLDLERR